MRRYWLVFGVVAMVLGSGCQATGMGFIQSALIPTDKATFGFVYDGTTMTLSGSYHDPQGQTAFGVVDVAFKGTGVLRPCKAGEPACAKVPARAAKGGCLFGNPSYTSQNPKVPDTGPTELQRLTLLVCDSDGTLGSSSPFPDDFILISVDTGPYMGYTNAGTPSGNITVKSDVSP
jgi:hypothetical protein